MLWWRNSHTGKYAEPNSADAGKSSGNVTPSTGAAAIPLMRTSKSLELPGESTTVSLITFVARGRWLIGLIFLRYRGQLPALPHPYRCLPARPVLTSTEKEHFWLFFPASATKTSESLFLAPWVVLLLKIVTSPMGKPGLGLDRKTGHQWESKKSCILNERTTKKKVCTFSNKNTN